jgi:hypothetical protein
LTKVARAGKASVCWHLRDSLCCGNGVHGLVNAVGPMQPARPTCF